MSRLDEKDPVRSVFAELIGLPCWSVKKGHGSMLTFEFGAPHLSIREPVANPVMNSPKALRVLSRRYVAPHGDWHLWIEICQWKCISHGQVLGTDLSADNLIAEVVQELNGQKLLAIEVDPSSRCTTFIFDLGGRLETRPYEDDDGDEQWSLFTPEGMVFTYRGDGRYSWGRSNEPLEEEDWRSL